MTYEELRDALEGLFAYDTGSVCSGIHDPRLKAKAFQYLNTLNEFDHRTTLARIVTELWLSGKAITDGYGPEDAFEFLRWLEDNGVLIPNS